MHITIWDHPAARFLLSGLSSSPYASTVTVEETARTETLNTLVAGETDVALITTLEALRNHDMVDVLPAVALSAWKYPFAKLHLKDGLSTAPAEVTFDAAFEQEAVVARMVLKEHYRMTPAFEASDPDVQSENRVEVGTGVEPSGQNLLDLGQEWFELSGYPMLWGVFATLKGNAEEDVIDTMRGIVATSEAQRGLFLRTNEQTPGMHDFISNQLRLRFDDLAIAGLTEFRQYLFFYGLLEDMTELPVVFVSDPDDDEDSDDDSDDQLQV